MEFKLVNQKLTLSLNEKPVRLSMFHCPAQPQREAAQRERQNEAAQREAAQQERQRCVKQHSERGSIG